jgi:hypothetical protein
MTNSLMPSKKVWVSEDGVEIEMITYRTILTDRLRNGLKSYFNADGTMPDELASFILCAATTTDVRLPAENAPAWGCWLFEMVNNPAWRQNIAKTYDDLVYAPSDMIDKWWSAYLETRDTTHDAPPELKQDRPSKPLPDPETGEVDQATVNFTSESKPDGAKQLTILSSPMPKDQPIARQRKAK